MNMLRSLLRRRSTILLAPLLALVLVAPSTAQKAQVHGYWFMTGISDSREEMFGNSLWKQLHTKVSRLVTPYDVAVRPYDLHQATTWIHDAEANHQKILVAFYHSEYIKMHLPSVAAYKKDVAKFIKLFPHIREYQAWDEANRGYVSDGSASFVSPSATLDAQYYQALKRDCARCTVVGLDVLDNQVIGPTVQYIDEFKREVGRLKTVMPHVWGLHDYSDLNHFESWRTHDLAADLGGEVWLTETGGIVKFTGDSALLNRNGAGLRRAARVLKYMFGVAASTPRVKRVYIYNWVGGTASTRFDAGLMNARFKPRPGYVVVCKELRAAHCNVKTVNN
ncbi:MAG TPA: hypothetical protein VNV42_11885 [Solirubrobacteraceae bacterium]|jgi:hypothetical protein|nr:hypothetical protein [Solirubrobacteraceae bacterium]